jgi:hypothetical protein
MSFIKIFLVYIFVCFRIVRSAATATQYTLWLGYSLNTLKIAISAAMVLPDPVGAPRRTFLSVMENSFPYEGVITLK